VLFDTQITSVILFEKKHIFISALEMASPENRHCANCIGTLSFRVSKCTLDISDGIVQSAFGVVRRMQHLLLAAWRSG